jgi:hypothetical protein
MSGAFQLTGNRQRAYTLADRGEHRVGHGRNLDRGTGFADASALSFRKPRRLRPAFGAVMFMYFSGYRKAGWRELRRLFAFDSPDWMKAHAARTTQYET